MTWFETNTASSISRQASLVQLNVTWLRQAAALLGRIDDWSYAFSPPRLFPHRVGGHLRHIIEFYECFLAGLSSKHIDYDSRQRDLSLETSRSVASKRISSVIERLEKGPAKQPDELLFVRAEDEESLELSNSFVTSSVSRELLTLSSHTIHHFALIAMALRGHGVPVDPQFGVAPSTLRYQSKKAEAA